jgi:hypothetical protein
MWRWKSSRVLLCACVILGFERGLQRPAPPTRVFGLQLDQVVSVLSHRLHLIGNFTPFGIGRAPVGLANAFGVLAARHHHRGLIL